MTNAERFIASFNRIQNYLSFLENEQEHKKPFYRLLDDNEHRNTAVKKYKKICKFLQISEMLWYTKN